MAVYTEVSDSQVVDLLQSYDLGAPRAVKGIAEGVENSNFLLVTERGQFILTLYEKRVDPADLPFFLGLMEHLAGKGVNCPVPVRTRAGELTAEIAGRPSAIATFLDGMWVRKPGLNHCAELGAALARMHLAGRDFSLHRKNALALEDWRPLFNRCADRADEVQPGLHDMIAAELDYLEANWPVDLPRGVIHADLFPDNVFFQSDRLSGLIDFYFSCNDLYAYEIAICLNAWCFESAGDFNVTKASHLLTRYRTERDVSPEEIDALPILARGSAMRFLLTRLFDWLDESTDGSLVRKKDPLEYVRKLRFHQQVTGPGAYGLT